MHIILCGKQQMREMIKSGLLYEVKVKLQNSTETSYMMAHNKQDAALTVVQIMDGPAWLRSFSVEAEQVTALPEDHPARIPFAVTVSKYFVEG